MTDLILPCNVKSEGRNMLVLDNSTIKAVIPSDLSRITDRCDIKRIFVNGKKALSIYERMLESKYGKTTYLPSTSPANAAWSVERLIEVWSVINC